MQFRSGADGAPSSCAPMNRSRWKKIHGTTTPAERRTGLPPSTTRHVTLSSIQERFAALGLGLSYHGDGAGDQETASLWDSITNLRAVGRAIKSMCRAPIPADLSWELAETVSAEARRVSRCPGKGCSACCRQDVIPVTRGEALEVARALDADGWGRAAAYTPGDPCPALDPVAGACTVYKSRPGVCRAYMVVSDPTECGKEDGRVGLIMAPAALLTAFLDGAGEDRKELGLTLRWMAEQIRDRG